MYTRNSMAINRSSFPSSLVTRASGSAQFAKLIGEIMQDRKERLKVIKDAEMRYVRMWERTRREQNMLRYQLEMDGWQETLKDYYVRERNENRVNGELTRHLTRRVAVSVLNFDFPLGIIYPRIQIRVSYLKGFRALWTNVESIARAR